MVRSFVKRIAATLVLAAGSTAAMPLTAVAAENVPNVTHYDTAITTVYGSPYPIAGHLDLEIFDNGIVRGYYHNAYQKAFIQVTGGRDGNYIWFNLGPNQTLSDMGLGFPLGPFGRLHVVASMDGNGGFRGQLYPLYTAALSSFVPANTPQSGPNSGSVNSTTAPFPQATVFEQYLFAAQPMSASSQDYPFTTAPSTPPPSP